MVKKIFFIAFIIFLSICVNELLKFNGEIVINFIDYQIATTTGFLLFLTIGAFIIFYFALYLLVSLFFPSINTYKKNYKKLEKNINKYIELISEAFVYKSARNINMASEKLKKANKVFKETNLSKLLESQIYYLKEDYTKSEEIFKDINDKNLNLNLLNLRINLEQSRKIGDKADIQKYAEELVKIEPINKTASEILFDIYMEQKNWDKAYKILTVGLKSGVFELNKIKNRVLFLYTIIGKKYYNNGEFNSAKSILRTVYKIDPTYIQAVIYLVETYIALGKTAKAIKIIKKVWKYDTNPNLANIYLSLLNEKDRRSIKTAETLYKINSNSYESNLLMAKACLNQGLYSKAREYAKDAEKINATKTLYEIMLRIEQSDNGSSTLIANLKHKINDTKNSCWKCSVCGTEYSKWQPECDKCKNLDTIEWSE